MEEEVDDQEAKEVDDDDDDDDYDDDTEGKGADSDARSPAGRRKGKREPEPKEVEEERIGLEDEVSDESADSIDDDAGVRQALTEAFVAKTKRQAAVLGTGSGADALLLKDTTYVVVLSGVAAGWGTGKGGWRGGGVAPVRWVWR